MVFSFCGNKIQKGGQYGIDPTEKFNAIEKTFSEMEAKNRGSAVQLREKGDHLKLDALLS
jgi:hypothetical protein